MIHIYDMGVTHTCTDSTEKLFISFYYRTMKRHAGCECTNIRTALVTKWFRFYRIISWREMIGVSWIMSIYTQYTPAKGKNHTNKYTNEHYLKSRA